MAGVAKAALVDEATLEQRRVIVIAAPRVEPIVIAWWNRLACGKCGAAQDEQDGAAGDEAHTFKVCALGPNLQGRYWLSARSLPW